MPKMVLFGNAAQSAKVASEDGTCGLYPFMQSAPKHAYDRFSRPRPGDASLREEVDSLQPAITAAC